jgi:signal transduction histidine kinase
LSERAQHIAVSIRRVSFVRGLRLRFASLFMLAVLPGLIAAACFNYFDYQSEKHAAAAALLDRVRQITAKDGALLGSSFTLLRDLAKRRAITNVASDPATCAHVMESVLATHPEFAYIGTFDRNGARNCSAASDEPDVNGADLSWFKRAAATRDLAVGGYSIGGADAKPSIQVGYPIVGDGGALVGVIGAGIDAAWLKERFGQLALESGIVLTLFDNAGMALAGHPDLDHFGGRDLRPSAAKIAARAEGIDETRFLDGKTRIFAFAPLGSTAPGELTVSLGIDPTILLASARWSLLLDLMTLGGVALLGVSVAFLYGKKLFIQPIDDLDRVAQRLTAGDLSARVGGRYRNDEFGHVASAFDRMAETSASREIELRRANEYKGRMLAIAGHDLRQPLQIIAMSHDVIGRGITDAKARKHLARAEQAVERLIHQLDLITMAGRLDGPALQPRLETVAIGSLIADIAAEQAAMAEAGGLELRVAASTATVVTDREMVATILRNLVGNAIKYTRRGRVLVGCRWRQEGLAVAVCDTGPGIQEDKLSRIFDEFYQLDPKSSGLGLGLSIVKRTADMLGYRLEVRSSVGRGSTFGIVIPFGEPGRRDRDTKTERPSSAHAALRSGAVGGWVDCR